MGWSMDRQGIRTLFDRVTGRLKQFELSGPRRGRISLDTYSGSVKKRDMASGRTQASRHTVCAVMTSAFLDFSKSRSNDLSTSVPEYGFPDLSLAIVGAYVRRVGRKH